MTLELVDVHITTTLLFYSVTVNPAIGGGGGGGGIYYFISNAHTLNDNIANSDSLAHDIPTPSISILSEVAGDVFPNSSIPLLSCHKLKLCTFHL